MQHILIVGAGKVGEYLAKNLHQKNYDVAIIEKDTQIAERIAHEEKDILVISGDGCDPNRLEDAQIKNAAVVAAVTGDDEDNLIICQLAKENYFVKRVIARINNPKNEETFKALDIEAVSATMIISKLIEEESKLGDIITLMSLKKGKIVMVEFELTTNSPAINQQIKDIKLPRQCILTSIVREEELIFPKGDTTLEAGDSILALTGPGQEKELKKSLLGEKKNNEK